MAKPTRPTISVVNVRATLVDLLGSAYSEPAVGPVVLPRATAYWRAKDYSGSGAWLDGSGNGHDAQLGSTSGADTNDPLHLPHTGTNYLYLPGAYNDRATVPSSAAFDLTGDFDIRVRLSSWNPGGTAGLVSKWGLGGHQSYVFGLSSSGVPSLWLSTDGSTNTSAAASAAPPFAEGEVGWMRVVRFQAAGLVRFYTSADGVEWTQLGTDRPMTTGALFITTDALDIGYGLAIGGRAAKLYAVQIFASTDETDPRLDIDFTAQAGDVTSFTEATGKTVTVGRSATGRKAVLVERPCFLLGTDDYFEVLDDPALDFGAAEDLTVVALFRYFGTPANGALFDKSGGATASSQGYLAYLQSTQRVRGELHDGTNEDAVNAGAATAGALTAAHLQRQGAQYRAGIGTDVGAWLAASAGDLSSAKPLTFGRLSGVNGNYLDAELFAVALFREALSDADLATLAAELV